MRNKLVPAIVFIAIGTISTWASAHTGVENHVHGSWMAGLVHPFVGIDHLAAMLAVGVWSALSARRAGPGLLWAPLGFASMLLVGTLMGLQGLALQGVEPMIAASLLVIGLLVIGRLQVPGFVAALLVGGFAVFHGLAHGYELAAAPNAAGTVIGMLSATALLHTAGLGLGWLLRSAHVWVPRAAGAAVALFGSALLLQLA